MKYVLLHLEASAIYTNILYSFFYSILAQPKKADWRKKHEDFIATVRAAKGIKGYEAPPMDTSDYVQCPHCGRKFSEGAAERHIPKCASIQSNKPAGGRRR